MSPLVCKPLEVIPPLALISPVELILILSVSVPLSVVKNCRFESFDDGNARWLYWASLPAIILPAFVVTLEVLLCLNSIPAPLSVPTSLSEFSIVITELPPSVALENKNALEVKFVTFTSSKPPILVVKFPEPLIS